MLKIWMDMSASLLLSGAHIISLSRICLRNASKQCNITLIQSRVPTTTFLGCKQCNITLQTVQPRSAPDLPGDSTGGKKKGNRNLIDGGAKKKHANMLAYANTNSNHHSNAIPGADDLGAKSGSSYSSICSISAQYFAKMQEVLIERNVPSELNSGFLTPWYVQHITMFYTCFSYVLHILFLFIHVHCNS